MKIQQDFQNIIAKLRTDADPVALSRLRYCWRTRGLPFEKKSKGDG